MEPAKPSLDLLRSLTDEHVLRALMQHRRLTRAELAAETGLSKPTAGESVRRLAAAGLVADTGERTPGGRGRGRVGSYYALAQDIGTALAVSIAPGEVVAERIDAYGDTVGRAEAAIGRPARPEQVTAALEGAAARVQQDARVAVVSAADPVDRVTGRLIHLPDSPFLVGELDPAQILAPYVSGPVIVDNDVNWAAQAERDHWATHAAHAAHAAHDQAETAPGDDFAYLFLGEGLGCAIVSDGQVRRGHSGLAGEVAHLVTAGPDGRAAPFIEVFGQLGLRQPGSTAIDVDRLVAAVTGQAPQAAATRHALGQAVGGVLAAVVALTDPQAVVIGGPWGSQPAVLRTIMTAAGRLPRPVPVRGARLAGHPSLAGARTDALTRLRTGIIHASGKTKI
ncbi:MAG TPA: ROK family transcriptional regulator [Streptosporangiaceae bacterium]|nr:ROK family transcriptional regulator [Streptosporangiaceae bacterium]